VDPELAVASGESRRAETVWRPCGAGAATGNEGAGLAWRDPGLALHRKQTTRVQKCRAPRLVQPSQTSRGTFIVSCRQMPQECLSYRVMRGREARLVVRAVLVHYTSPLNIIPTHIGVSWSSGKHMETIVPAYTRELIADKIRGWRTA
jgi:hypothetical protein